MKGRVRADPRRWRGPATVIAKEEQVATILAGAHGSSWLRRKICVMRPQRNVRQRSSSRETLL